MAFCPSCGQAAAENARFCASCGAPLATAPASREARKVVTALFADVVGSTVLGERMDPEDFNAVVGDGVARMAVAVEAFGGEIIQLEGDGLLALFGAPIAHEDDPERATLAGLRIVDEIGRYATDVARDWGIEDFAVRVGIETGLAVLGPVGGGGTVRYGAAGDALNTAARLQAAAEASTVLVGAETQRLIAPLFEWGEPRELTLKGKSAPVVAYPAIAARPSPSRPRSAAVEADLVGRADELTIGREAIARVADGAGSILLVSGEAGIGKTRLVAELRKQFEDAHSANAPARWLEGRCVSYGEALPYWPFRGLLREWLAREESPEQDVGHALQTACERLFGERAEELLPLLEPVLGLGAREGARGDQIAPELLQRQIQDAVASLFERLAAERPLAVSVDDLHWADTSSLTLIERLTPVVKAAPILLVLTGRAQPGDSVWLPDRTDRIILEALPEGSDRHLLASLVGEGTLPAELERRLLTRAEGNPLYLEELVGSMVDAGALTRSNGGWRFDRDVPIHIPETVEKVILARIDRLDDRAHDLLGRAAVLGRQFPIALLDAIADPGAELTAPILELRRADLIREGPAWPAESLAFKHTLIQEAAYRSLLKRRRQELHLAAAEAIEDIYADRIGEFWGMLAHHTGAAGDDRRALEYHRRAGEAARLLYAVDEAIEHYGGAIDSAGRLGIGPQDPVVRDLMLQRGVLRFESGEGDAGRADLEEALRGARATKDAEAQTEALIGLVGAWRALDTARARELLDEAVDISQSVPGAGRVNALARLSIHYANQLRFDRAVEVGEQAMRLAEEAGDPDAAALAMDSLKLTALQLGDLPRLEELTRRLAQTFRGRAEDDFYLQWVLLEAAFVPLGAGRFEEAIALFEEALDLTRRRGHRVHEPLFIDALCWAHRSRGDYPAAVAHGRAASDLAYDLRHREWAAWTDATLGWALLESRAPEEAVECLERGLRTAEMAAATAPLTRCTALLAWARSMLGERREAAERAARAEELLAAVGAAPGTAWLFGAHAYLAVARANLDAGNPERAEELAASIAGPAASSGWREPHAAASLVLGQARAALGQADAAERALEEALAIAEEAGLPAPAWEAHAGLAGVLAETGREDEAEDHARRARLGLERLGLPLSEAARRSAAAPG